MMTKGRVILVLVILSATSVPSFALEPTVVEDAKYQKSTAADNSSEGPSALVLKLQILLDRAHFSPGIIDGRMGDNTVYALREFEKRLGLPADGHLDHETWTRLSQNSAKVLVTYTVKAKDIAGPFAESIPDDYGAMAEMERLSYTSAWELLSEKFHVDIELLKSLNPNARLDLKKPGNL